MARKRKIKTTIHESSTVNVSKTGGKSREANAIFNVITCAQNGETYYEKCIKEMKNIYKNLEHDNFIGSFKQVLKVALWKSDDRISITILKFCAQYIAVLESGEDTHPVTMSVFHWLLSTISPDPTIRYRMCLFVNYILSSLGPEAALDDDICNAILKYMFKMLLDLSPNVRVQAIVALQRLQDPDNSDDPVFKIYIFHMENDPSAKVRQAVVTSIGRNVFTIPYIIERLWDSDDKVRRHTYIQMSSYPVKSYQVAQRLKFLEQGLNDNSESVCKVVKNIMLPNWIEAYGRNYVAFITGLKLDANAQEIGRFRTVAIKALLEIFPKHNKADITAALHLSSDEENFKKCIPIEQLTLEKALFWQAVVEYTKNDSMTSNNNRNDNDEDDAEAGADEFLPELSVYCDYVDKYISTFSDDWDPYQKITAQYILLMLLEIIAKYDLGDEIGRDKLKILLSKIVREIEVEDESIKIIVKIFEELFPQTEDRLEHLVNLVRSVIDPETNVDNSKNIMIEYLDKHPNKELEFKISKLKLKIMDLKELEQNFVEKKDYANAQKIADELQSCDDEYKTIVGPIISEASTSSKESNSISSLLGQRTKKLSKETTSKCLQIAFYMVASKKVTSLTPNVGELYKDFIRRNIESQHIKVREWALQCGTAYSMLYDVLVIDLIQVLHQQFFKHSNKMIWKVSIRCIFELLDKYGIDHFNVDEAKEKIKKTGRQLYNTTDYLDQDETSNSSTQPLTKGTDLIKLMTHLLEQCDTEDIVIELIDGFCRIVLRGHLTSTDIMSKLLLKFFNPDTENEINQVLAIFFEAIMKEKKQQYLQSALLPTLFAVMEAAHDSPLHEIKPETILKFVINATKPLYSHAGIFLHNDIAKSFLETMLENPDNKELFKILTKELLVLELAEIESDLKTELLLLVDKLLEIQMEPKTEKCCRSFKEILVGKYKAPISFSSSKLAENPDGIAENETQAQPENVKSVEVVETEESATEDDPTDPSNGSVVIPNPFVVAQKKAESTAPTTYGTENISGLLSLRKLTMVRADSRESEGSVDIPTAIQCNSSNQSFVIPATQYIESTSPDATIEHIEIPETQQIRNSPEQSLSTQESPSAVEPVLVPKVAGNEVKTKTDSEPLSNNSKIDDADSDAVIESSPVRPVFRSRIIRTRPIESRMSKRNLPPKSSADSSDSSSVNSPLRKQSRVEQASLRAKITKTLTKPNKNTVRLELPPKTLSVLKKTQQVIVKSAKTPRTRNTAEPFKTPLRLRKATLTVVESPRSRRTPSSVPVETKTPGRTRKTTLAAAEEQQNTPKTKKVQANVEKKNTSMESSPSNSSMNISTASSATSIQNNTNKRQQEMSRILPISRQSRTQIPTSPKKLIVPPNSAKSGNDSPGSKSTSSTTSNKENNVVARKRVSPKKLLSPRDKPTIVNLKKMTPNKIVEMSLSPVLVRTRSAAIEEIKQSKVMTRNSLSESSRKAKEKDLTPKSKKKPASDRQQSPRSTLSTTPKTLNPVSRTRLRTPQSVGVGLAAAQTIPRGRRTINLDTKIISPSRPKKSNIAESSQLIPRKEKKNETPLETGKTTHRLRSSVTKT